MGTMIELGVVEANNEKKLQLEEQLATAVPQTPNKIKTEHRVAIPKK